MGSRWGGPKYINKKMHSAEYGSLPRHSSPLKSSWIKQPTPSTYKKLMMVSTNSHKNNKSDFFF